MNLVKIVGFSGLTKENGSQFDPETLRYLNIQMAAYGTVAPCLTYYQTMAWEGFWVNPRLDVMERVAITEQELLWILKEATENQDPLIERNVVSLVVVKKDDLVWLFALYWTDVLVVEQLIFPLSDEFYFFDKGFNRCSVVHRSNDLQDRDLRWK